MGKDRLQPQWPHEQCVTVTSLDDPCLFECINCSMSHGKIPAFQGLAGAPSYVLNCTPGNVSEIEIMKRTTNLTCHIVFSSVLN